MLKLYQPLSKVEKCLLSLILGDTCGPLGGGKIFDKEFLY
jgi:hypothetical protein